MLRFHQKPLISLYNSSFLASFSVISKRNFVPKLLKDPKFTRTGIAKKKKKSYQYDLTKSYIINPHLYYDEKNDKIQQRHEYRARRALHNEYPPITADFSTEHLLNNLNDEFLYQRASSRILSVIVEIEKRDKGLVVEHYQLIQKALKKLSQKAFFFNIREFGILVTLANKYLRQDQEVWTKFLLNFQRILEKHKYYQQDIFSTKNREKNLVFIFNHIAKACKTLKIQGVDDISNSLREGFKEKLDKIDNLSHKIVFLTTLITSSPQTGEFLAIFQEFLKKHAQNLSEINEKDALALLQSMQKLKVHDPETMKKLGKNH